MASPVTKISSDGKAEAVFRLDTAPGFSTESTFDDFAVDPRGNVYLLAVRDAPRENQGEPPESEQLVVAYDADGHYNSTIKLEALFGIAQLAVFTSGELLVSGTRIVIPEETPRGSGNLLTAIFDRRGHLLKELSLSGDIESQEPEAESASRENEGPPVSPRDGSSKPQTSAKLSAEDFSKALGTSTSVPADDGNIYLMRATHDPLIYVVSPGGALLRRLQIRAPAEHGRPASLQVAAGRIVVLFIENNETGKFKGHILAVANAENGETLAHYPVTPDLGGGLACYTPDGFTFVGAREGKLLIRKTYPH